MESSAVFTKTVPPLEFRDMLNMSFNLSLNAWELSQAFSTNIFKKLFTWVSWKIDTSMISLIITDPHWLKILKLSSWRFPQILKSANRPFELY